MSERPDITPDLKVGALLDAWPELEDELIAAAPPFAKLRNPVLRRTVARVTSLRQAAQVGGVPLAELIGRLRAAAGLPAVAVAEEGGGEGGRPAWLDTVTVVERYDARADLEAGLHPVGKVLPRLRSLGPHEAYELVTGFAPTPLVDKARDLGSDAHTRVEAEGVFVTTFRGAGGGD